jgi:hypothetical protein
VTEVGFGLFAAIHMDCAWLPGWWGEAQGRESTPEERPYSADRHAWTPVGPRSTYKIAEV